MAASGAVPPTPPAAPAQFSPTDTHLFATLMQGASATAPLASPGALGTIGSSFAAQFSNTRSFEEIRHSMLQSFDASDPLKSMFMMTSDAMEAQMLFSKLHISTSLASSATSLFGNLLKNQQ